MMTGLRPTWSDSRPSTRKAASKAIAYTANITVSVVAENFQDPWYTSYNGDGAAAAAINVPSRPPISQKATLRRIIMHTPFFF